MLDYESDEENSGLAIGVNKTLLEGQVLPETYSERAIAPHVVEITAKPAEAPSVLFADHIGSP